MLKSNTTNDTLYKTFLEKFESILDTYATPKKIKRAHSLSDV